MKFCFSQSKHQSYERWEPMNDQGKDITTHYKQLWVGAGKNKIMGKYFPSSDFSLIIIILIH